MLEVVPNQLLMFPSYIVYNDFRRSCPPEPLDGFSLIPQDAPYIDKRLVRTPSNDAIDLPAYPVKYHCFRYDIPTIPRYSIILKIFT